MIEIQVTDRAGLSRSITVEPGANLMEVLRDSGCDELLALCGGCCSCATCHVFIEGGPVEHLAPKSPDEDDLLDSSEYRNRHSRLACQIPLTENLTGLSVRIAPED